MPQTTWEKEKNKILKTPKFLRNGTKVMVDPETPPVEREVDGRWGKRQVYVINTREHGLVYVSPMQLVKVAEAFKGDYSQGAVTVEL